MRFGSDFQDGETALHMVAQSGSAQSIQALLAGRADVHAANKVGLHSTCVPPIMRFVAQARWNCLCCAKHQLAVCTHCALFIVLHCCCSESRGARRKGTQHCTEQLKRATHKSSKHWLQLVPMYKPRIRFIIKQTTLMSPPPGFDSTLRIDSRIA